MQCSAAAAVAAAETAEVEAEAVASKAAEVAAEAEAGTAEAQDAAQPGELERTHGVAIILRNFSTFSFVN